MKIKIVLPGYLPPPKARPRFGGGGRVYSPSAKKEMALAWMIKASLPGVQFAGEVKVTLRLYSTKVLRGDVDNYLKFVLDALQKSGIIENDRLAMCAACEKLRAGENCTEIEIEE